MAQGDVQAPHPADGHDEHVAHGAEHPFAAMSSAFARALERGAESAAITLHFTFGGHVARLRVLGNQLARELLRPFAHLRTSHNGDSAAALRIDVWDESVTGEPVLRPRDTDAGWKTWPAGDGRFLASADGRYVCYDTAVATTWLDRHLGRIVGWRATWTGLSVHERTRPIPFILPLWMQDHGVQLIHAGLVSRDARGVLFCGNNGTGKSTCSLLCLCAGLDFLSDDHVGLEEMPDGRFRGHSLYASTRLEPAHLSRFPLLAPHGIPSDDPKESKSLVQLAEIFSKRMKGTVPIRALVLPRIVVSRAGALLSPVSSAEAFRTLAPSSLLMLPFMPARRGFDTLVRLVERVPAYRLEMGRDLEAIPARLNELLDSLTVNAP
jgi:hypothetical protein